MKRTIFVALGALLLMVSAAPVQAEVINVERDSFDGYYYNPCTGALLYVAGSWHVTASLVEGNDGILKLRQRQTLHGKLYDVETKAKIGVLNSTWHFDIVGLFDTSAFPDFVLLGDFVDRTVNNDRWKIKGSPPAIMHSRTTTSYVDGDWDVELEILKWQCDAD